MQANSREVHSPQNGPHPKLSAVVQKHLQSPSRKPVAEHNRAAFERLRAALADHGGPLVIDAFCGTGHSTAALALQHTDCLVVGIDQSDHRLTRHPESMPDNALLLRAQCEDIWRQLAQTGQRARYQYLLYPNPWPKSSHLQRRVHGSNAFTDLLTVGGALQLRSNWPLYLEEFGIALAIAGVTAVVARCEPQSPLTLFEAKYSASGHALWQLQAQLP